MAVRVAVHQPSPDSTWDNRLDSTPDLSCTNSAQGHWVDAEHQPTDLAVGVRVRLEPRRLMPVAAGSQPPPGPATGSRPTGPRAPAGPGPGRTAPSPPAAPWSSGPRTRPAPSRSGGP